MSRLRRVMDVLVTAALCFALGAAQQDAQATEARASVDLSQGLHGEQQRAWACEAKVYAYLAGRRHGKSHYLRRKLVQQTAVHPGSVNPYLSITRKHAKLNFWKGLKACAIATRLEPHVNESDLTIDFERSGGGMLVLGGLDKIDELDKSRGSGMVLAVVDECGVYPSGSLKYLHQDVLQPATADYAGSQLVFGGTPGPTLSGYWHELTNPRSAIPVFRGTMLDNPAIPDPAGFLEEVKELNGWNDRTPKYRREYLGQWCEDPGELVFPVQGHNYVTELPTRSEHGAYLDPSRWYYTMGSDIGASPGKTTLVVVATHPDLATAYIVHAEAHVEWLISQWVARFKYLREGTASSAPRFPNATLVIDAGGMGKAHAVELTKHWGEGFLEATKDRKASMVEIARNELIAGRVKMLRGAATQPLRDEWAVLGWAEDKRTGERLVDALGTPYPNKDAEQHCSDAGLYALRHAWTYRKGDRKPPPPPGSAEEWQQREKDIIRRRVRNRNRRTW